MPLYVKDKSLRCLIKRTGNYNGIQCKPIIRKFSEDSPYRWVSFPSCPSLTEDESEQISVQDLIWNSPSNIELQGYINFENSDIDRTIAWKSNDNYLYFQPCCQIKNGALNDGRKLRLLNEMNVTWPSNCTSYDIIGASRSYDSTGPTQVPLQHFYFTLSTSSAGEFAIGTESITANYIFRIVHDGSLTEKDIAPTVWIHIGSRNWYDPDAGIDIDTITSDDDNKADECIYKIKKVSDTEFLMTVAATKLVRNYWYGCPCYPSAYLPFIQIPYSDKLKSIWTWGFSLNHEFSFKDPYT